MPITPNAATVTVSDSGSLKDAYNTLSRSGGGTIEVAQGSRPIEIALSSGGQDHVAIISANDDAPTLLYRISFDKVENVTVSDFRIDSSDVSRPGWHKDVMVSGSADIVIENSAFASNAVGRYSPGQAGTVLGETLGLVRNSRDFSFDGNTVADYYHGLSIQETTGASVTGNEFSGLQGDGLRLAGVQQTVVSDNDMRDFIGTTRTFNHNDFIQVWSSNAKLVTRDLEIRGNTLDSGSGSSAQGIFVGNEQYSRGDKGHRYENIDISDNLVRSGNTNGIAVFGATDVDVSNNTVLWNNTAKVVDNSGESGNSRAPQIRFTNVTEGVIADNITSGTIAGSGTSLSGNKILSYSQPNDPNYVGANFVNALGGGGSNNLDFRLRPDSPWNGIAGSSLTEAKGRSNAGIDAIFTIDVDRGNFHGFTFDASRSVDESGRLGDGYDFVWTFGDGTVLRGETVDHVFADAGTQDVSLGIYRDGRLVDQSDRSIEVQSKTLLDIDLNGPVGDTSSYDSRVTVVGAQALSEGYQIGGQNRVEISRGSQQIHDLESFGMTMDLKILNGDSGRFLLLHEVMDATVRGDGTLRFTLKTDEGKFTVDSGSVTIDDGRFHELGFDYDGERLSLYVDGTIVGETDAGGTTAGLASHHLILGSKWSAGVDAVVNNLTLNAEPSRSDLDTKDDGTDPQPLDPEPVASEPPVPVAPEEPETVPETVPDEMPEADGDTPSAPASPTAPFGPVVVDLDFQADPVDRSLNRFDRDALVQSGTDASYRIGTDHTFQIDRRVDELHGLEAFSLEMDVTADTGDLSGALLHFHKAFEVTTGRDGSLRFKLETDEGSFSVTTDGNPLADGEEHRLGVAYDDDLGKMSLRVDDRVVAEGEASGVTADKSYFGLTVGHSWADKGANSFSMLVDEFVLRTRVSEGVGADGTSASAPAFEVPVASPAEEPGLPSDPVRNTTQNDLEIFL